MNDPARAPRERRGMPRWTIDEEATLQANGELYPCKLADISASGVRFECAATLAVGDTPVLRLHGIQPLGLRVVRVEPGSIAATFVDGPHYLFR